MKLQPKLRSRRATLPWAVTRYLSPVTVRYCFALLLCVVITRGPGADSHHAGKFQRDQRR